MTREERKQEKSKKATQGGADLAQAAREYGNDLSHDSCEQAFLDGAKWIIDKACEWLDKEMEDYVERFNDDDVQPIVISGSYDYKKDFIEALRKAMEQ